MQPLRFSMRLRVGAALLLLCASNAASALEFAGEPLIFLEDYAGESSYPTTPEVAVSVLGISVPDPATGVTPATLNGTTAQVSVTGVDIQAVQAIGINLDSVAGLRGDFDNLVLGSDGTALAFIEELTAELGGQFDVRVSVEVSVSGGVNSADLILTETEILAGSPVSVTLALPTAAADAIAGGGAFTLDLLVDRITNVALGSIAVAGEGVFLSPALALTSSDTQPVSTFVFQGGGAVAPAPTTTTLDITQTAVYSDLAVYEPRFNIDVGTELGTPSSSYAGAGTAGSWNSIGLGVTALVDTDGEATSVTADLTTATDEGFVAAPASDLVALLNDYAFDCTDPDEWTLRVAGLPPGDYKVVIYGPPHAIVDTGSMLINGVAVPSLTGDTSASLIPEISYARVRATVVGDALNLSGTGTGSPICAGISGIQIEHDPATPKVPSLSPAALLLLATLLLGAAVHRGSRWRAGTRRT